MRHVSVGSEVNLTNAPLAVVSFIDELLTCGFVAVDERSDGPANGTIELRHARVGIRILVDRGQWFIEGGAIPGADWFDADLWRSYLVSGTAPLQASPIDDQVEFFRSNLDGLDAFANPEVTQRLSELRIARAYGRLGLT